MALLEMMGLSGDKLPVILDIGEAYTKIGLAGEPVPRHIIPTEFRRVNGDKVEVMKVVCYDAKEEELFEMLKDFLHMIYFKYLLVNPKERRVVVCESLLCPVKFRNTLARVLFKHFEVVSVAFAPTHLLALFTLGIPSALVLDCGYSESLVVPIYEQTPILAAIQSLPIAGNSLHQHIRSHIIENGRIKVGSELQSASNYTSYFTEKTLEDIKVRTCFVGGHGVPQTKVPPDVNYPLEGGETLIIDGTLRAHTYEILFEGDEEEKSLATILLDAIVKCPIDCRKAMAENIVLVGGTCMSPGFESRLLAEIKVLLNSVTYNEQLAIKTVKLRHPPVHSNYVSWLGGAIYGALEILGDRSISKERYKENPILPDWASLLSHTKNGAPKGSETRLTPRRKLYGRTFIPSKKADK